MPYIKFQSGVKVLPTAVIVAAVNNANVELNTGLDMLCTSGNDKVHMQSSLHYRDLALDFRTHDLPSPAKKQEFAKVVKRRLGRDYDVILEDMGLPNEHLHVEYDPK